MEPAMKVIESNDRARRVRERGAIYGLLACLYRREPNRDLISELRRPDVYRQLVGAGMELDADELLAPAIEQVVTRLGEDYAALFIAPGTRIPLNESVHREGEGSFMGNSTIHVRRFIRSLGMNIDARWTEFADHLAIEFEIMQRLADAEADGCERKDADLAADCAARQRTLLDEHISQWVPGLCDAIERGAGSTFYRELARLTRSFVEREIDALGESA